MFLKPFKIKNNTPLKGSDVKKLRQRLQREFPDTNPEILFPPKSSVNVMKLITYSEFQTNVYCADKMPMFFENEENKLVPTVYSLWLVMDLLPFFTTFPSVLPKLSNGADLMLPGVTPQGTGLNIYGRFKKGQLVGVNLTSNKSAVGVGYLPRSSDDLYMCGGHGVAVKILHLFGDKLWGIEPSLAQQVPQFKMTKLTEDDFPELGSTQTHKKQAEKNKSELDNLVIEQLENLTIAEEAVEDHAPTTTQETTLENNFDNAEETEENCKKNEYSPEMLLKHAFLSALKNNGKKLQLPLLTSNFFRLYVVPEAQEPIDLKKTKYKKLSNFLNEMIDEGFLVVREESKGVDKIISIDLEHPEIVNFITDYKKPIGGTDSSLDNPLFHSELTELYTVTDITAPLFTKLNYKRGEAIPATQIKKIIKEYVNKQNLVISKDIEVEPKSYILDECLEKICNAKVASLTKIIDAVLTQMDHSYQMCTAKDIKSNKPLIQMSLATKSGNKKVTLVSNIECYGIILAEFIKLCKQGAAASTTIVTQQNREMLQIQGNQVRFVFNLLTETYKIPPRCILGLELAKDGKKHKKK